MERAPFSVKNGKKLSSTIQHLTFADVLIQGWEKGQESHYIQPSNLSSALHLDMNRVDGQLQMQNAIVS